MARSFNNSNTYLSLASAPVTAVPLSISCWFYPAATNDTYDAVFVKNAGGSDYFGIYLNTTGSSAKVGAVVGNSAEGIAESTTTFSASTWQHAAAVFTSATSRAAFLNGGSKGTDATNLTPVGITQTNIGGFFVSPTVFGPMNGRLAEVGIWNVALTDDEVKSLSKGASPLNVRPQNLIAYWPLYGAASPEPNYVRNSTSLALTLNNAPTQIDHPPVMAPMSGMRPRNSNAAAAAGDTVTVTKADAVFTGKTVTVLDLDVIPVLKAAVTLTGQTVTIRDTDVIPVLKASATFAGKTVTLVDRDVIPVTQGTITCTGKTVTIRDADVVPVAKATVLFAGKSVSITDLVATQVIPVGKGDILFSGGNVTITDISVEPPTVGLPGGGEGFYVPPYLDYGRKKRRRYRALEEIEKRIDERIERLTAETRETQEKVAAVLEQNVSQPEQFDVLIQQQVRITALLHDAQKRAEKVRQEKIELAQLARLAAFEADEEEAITMLLLT